ncbi:MAG: serine hydrolase domain-containing protein [Planctomycetota bacterium]
MDRHHAAAVTLAGFVAMPVLAQGIVPPVPAQTQPAELALDPRDLTEDLEAIRSVLVIPSLAAAADRDGDLIGVGATGWYSMEHATPVSPSNKYHIGSCSKAMTAVLLGTIIEEHDKLDWDTTLPEALPEYARFINAAYANTTIRDLLSHRSGLIENRDQAILPLAWVVTQDFAEEGLTVQRRELLKTALSVAPAAEPGTEFGYSNFAYIVAAVIAETHTGESYEDLLHERIFEPLGMTTAGFGPPGGPGEVVEPLGHTRQDEWMPMMFNSAGVAPDNPPVFNSAGRVHASVVDWGRFVADFEQGLTGEGKLLQQSTYQSIAADLEADGYALGWGRAELDWAGETPVLSHAGSNRMWFAVATIAPDKDLSLVVATNAATADAQRATEAAMNAMVERFTWTPDHIEAASSPLTAPAD